MTVFQPDAKHPIDELFNWQKDTSVEPPVLLFGQLALSANGNYVKWDGSVSARSPDAGLQRVSSLQDSGTNLNISAKSLDAGTLLISAKQGSADQLRVSTFSPDASTFRVSAFGVNIADVSNSDAADFRVSAFIDSGSVSSKQGTYPWSVSGNISAAINEGTNFLGQVSAIIKNYPLTVSGTVSAFINQGTISAYSPDASLFRVSAVNFPLTVSGTVSAFINQGTVSAYSPDAALFRVSGIIDNGSVSAKSSDAGTFLVSAKQGDAGLLLISAKQGDAALFRVSSLNTAAASFIVSAIVDNGSISARSGDANQVHVSATQLDAGLLLVSAKSGTATQMIVSATQGDAGLLRVSAKIFGNSLGSLSIYRSISISSAKNIKTTAGAIYGMDLFSTSASTLQFVKFYNTSATPTLGTDVPVMTIPLSAAGGIKPIMTQYALGITFSNGIAIGATSALADNATTTVAASSIIGNIYYI